jgi:renal tumor antigen
LNESWETVFLINDLLEYKLISRKGEGTFSEVLKAQSLKTGNYVAIKCMKTHFTSVDQVRF